MSVYCDGFRCHVLCLFTVTGGMSCPVSVYCDRFRCHVLCLFTVTGGMSCPVSVYCDRVGCHVLCLYTVTGLGVTSCVCIDLVRVTSRPREVCLRRHFGDYAVGIFVFAQHSDMAYIQIKM